MPKLKKATLPLREKFFSVVIRFAWFVGRPQSTTLELRIKANLKSDAIDHARLLFHVLHYDEATTHYIVEGIRVYPWNISALEFPVVISRAFEEQSANEENKEKKGRRTTRTKETMGKVFRLFPPAPKKEDDPPTPSTKLETHEGEEKK